MYGVFTCIISPAWCETFRGFDDKFTHQLSSYLNVYKWYHGSKGCIVYSVIEMKWTFKEMKIFYLKTI